MDIPVVVAFECHKDVSGAGILSDGNGARETLATSAHICTYTLSPGQGFAAARGTVCSGHEKPTLSFIWTGRSNAATMSTSP